jgi:hypothetical protein
MSVRGTGEALAIETLSGSPGVPARDTRDGGSDER